jgi:hypothetical protein
MPVETSSLRYPIFRSVFAQTASNPPTGTQKNEKQKFSGRSSNPAFTMLTSTSMA